MSSSKPSGESVALQKQSLEEQRRQNEAMMAFYARQEELLRKQHVSAYRAPSPPPTPASAGSDQARLMMGLDAQRRFGYADTMRGGLGRFAPV